MSEEFQFPPLEVHLVEKYGDEGDKVVSALTPPVCDFCGDARVRWDYDCDDFVIEHIPVFGGVWGSTGGFASCDTCSAYIERDAWTALSIRIVRSWLARGFNGDHTEMMDDAETFVREFRAHYKLGRKAFG